MRFSEKGPGENIASQQAKRRRIREGAAARIKEIYPDVTDEKTLRKGIAILYRLNLHATDGKHSYEELVEERKKGTEKLKKLFGEE